jgi:hypothetical protein
MLRVGLIQPTGFHVQRFTYCREIRRANVDPHEQGFVDAFNTLMLSLTQSG